MYYHISSIRGLMELKPHVPEGAQWGEPDVPRVCAAPTVEQCMLGLADISIPVGAVYAIDREPDVDSRGVADWGNGGEVYDAAITGEVWYLSAVPCREVARTTATGDGPNLWKVIWK